MHPRFSIVVAGHLALDMIPDLSMIPEKKFMQAMQPGRLVVVGPSTFSTGGAVSNTGCALNRLGVPVKLIAKVGSDYFGDVVRSIIRDQGKSLEETLIIDSSTTTSFTIIINPPGVDRMFLHCPGANDDFSSEDISDQILQECGLLHFGYPPLMKRMYLDNGKVLIDIFSRAKNAGVSTSLDLAFPNPTSEAGQADWKTILSSVFPYVDIFVPSFEELLFLFHRDQYLQLLKPALGGDVLRAADPEILEELGTELIRLGVGIVMIKLGDRGIYLHTADQTRLAKMGRGRPSDLSIWENKQLWAPCFQVKVAGTTGSGDATIAGFLSAICRDLNPIQAATAAVAVGACNVEAPDSLGGIRTWEETTARIDAGWARLSLVLSHPDWHWNEKANIWEKKGS